MTMKTLLYQNRIKELRSNRGMTQAQLGRVIGKTTSSIQKYELGLALPPLDVAQQLADFFDVTLDYLCGRPESTPEDDMYILTPKGCLKAAMMEFEHKDDEFNDLWAEFQRMLNAHGYDRLAQLLM